MSPYFYIGDNAHESMYIPVNGMDLYTISKEHRDMFIGQCAPNTVVNLCFFGDTPLGMAVYIEDKGYVRYI